jgi:uncharacterized protein (TIGR03790 family)
MGGRRWWLLLVLALGACGDDGGDGALDAAVIDAAIEPDGSIEADALTPTDAGPPDPTVILPRLAIEPTELAVLVNDDDPLSVAVADAYVEARAIPEANVVHLTLPMENVLSRDAFATAEAAMEDALPEGIEALALTWTQPFRVDCMSITSAFALGFDEMYCNTEGGCAATAPVDYYGSASTHPLADHDLRPTMMLAATSSEGGMALVDRGVAADDTFPSGDGYLVRTTDMARSVRYPTFPGVVSEWEGALDFTYVDNADGSGENVITDTADVLFYFTGLARVASIETNTYLPGAIADHLTSFGGRVPTSGQMSIMEWIDAGATGSYGTVVEPCNYQQKFPSVPVVVDAYFHGATLVEAYWKSVRWPGEGLFVGEPLARPYGLQEVSIDADSITIETNAVRPGESWAVQSAESMDGPWTTEMEVSTEVHERMTIVAPRTGAPFVRLERL